MLVLFSIPLFLFIFLGTSFAILGVGPCLFLVGDIFVGPKPWFPQLWQIFHWVAP